MSDEIVVLNFDSDEAAVEWKTVDDVVMGGVSDSSVRWVPEQPGEAADAPGILRFEGNVSLENNGGFCSARQEESERGLPEVERLIVTARGDGKSYKCTIRTSGTPGSSSWRLRFETEPDRWRHYELPLAEFELWRRGTRLAGDDPLRSDAITSIGMLISDEQAGPFRLDLAEIRAR